MSKSGLVASSFVTEVLNTAGPLEKDDINTKLDKLSKRVDGVKMEVFEALQKKFSEFHPDLTAAMQLNDRAQTLSTEMDTMAVKIEKEIKTKLQASTSEFQDLSHQLQETKTRHDIIEKLVCIHENMEAINKDLHKNDFVSAANRLDIIDERFRVPANEREKEVKILTVQQSQYVLLEEKLKQDVSTAWANCVKWIYPDVHAADSETKTIKIQVESGEKARKMLTNILQALHNIELLEPKLQAFGDKLNKNILKSTILAVEISKSNDSSELTVITSREKPDVPQCPKDAFERLVKILSFFNEHVFSIEIDIEKDETISLMTLLGQVLSAGLQEDLINNSLAKSVPSNQKDLDSYRQVITDTEHFHKTLIELRFIDTKDTILIDFVRNINALFANKKCQEILERAQKLMTSELHNMVKVSGDHPFGELPPLDISSGKKSKGATEPLVLPANMRLSACIFKMPSFCVSAHAQAVIELAYETLVEATESSPPCAVQLFYCVRNMFELYCSVVPTYHRDSLENLPQLSALQQNNCMYIAHHLLTMGHQYSSKLPPPLNMGTAQFIDLVPCIRRLGTECFLKQLTKQRDQLLDILKQAKGFAGVAESESRLTAERTIKQIMHQLKHLANIWRPVLPENIYVKSMGTLLRSVLVEIMGSVTSLEDISADDASQLHALMSIITVKAPTLFQSVESESTSNSADTATTTNAVLMHQNVRKWSKYEEILMLLNANLQGISDRWADGKGPLAAECSANEVRQMIRALFQNTDRRAAVLARIK